LPINRHLFLWAVVARASRGKRCTPTESLLPLVNRATRVSPSKATRARRSSSEAPEARAPLADEEFLAFFDDPADLIEFMLFEAFVAAQRNGLQPEFTGAARFFNVDVRRLEFIREIKVETVAGSAQNRWHSLLANLGACWHTSVPLNPPQTNTPNPPSTSSAQILPLPAHRRWFGPCSVAIPKSFPRRFPVKSGDTH